MTLDERTALSDLPAAAPVRPEELSDDPRVQSVLSRALTAVGVVVVMGAIALSVWAAGA